MAFFSGGNERVKLIMLYVLRQFRTPITWEQLYTTMTYEDCPGFFETGEIYSELVAGGFIACVPAKGQQLLFLTEKGASVCGLFQNEIARSVRDSVDERAEAMREEYKRSNCVISDAKPLPSGAWQLELALLDNGGSLMELNMRMPDSAYAYKAQRRWARHSEQLYMQLMTELTAEEQEEPAEESPRAVGLANPVRGAESAERVNAQVGCGIAPVPGAREERFSWLAVEPPLGQYVFELEGAEFTLRASRSAEDITGVWVSGGTLTDAAAGERELAPTVIEGWRLMRFFRGDMQYVLYSEDASEESFLRVAEFVKGAVRRDTHT